MRKIFTQFLVLVFVSFAFFAKGQVFERTFHPDLFSHGNDISPNGSGGWYVVGHQGEIWVGLDYVLNLDAQGNVLWETTSISEEAVHGKQISLLSNNDFVVTGEIGLCDVGPGFFAAKISANGLMAWGNSDMANNYSGYNSTGVVEKSNGQLALLDYDGFIYRYNPNDGQEISYNLTNAFWDLVGLPNDLSVGLTPNKQLFLLSNNDNTIAIHAFMDTPKLLKSHNDTVSVVAGSKIYTFDNQLNNLAIHDFSSHFFQVVDYEIHSDGYQIIGQNGGQYYLKCFNNSGNLIQTILFDDKREPKAISRQGNILAVIGNETSDYIGSMLSSENLFVQTFDLNLMANNLDTDIEVLAVETDSLHEQPDYCPATGGTVRKVKWSGLRVLVKNNGTTPINSFQLHGKKQQGCNYGCGTGGYAYKKTNAENLNLQPGDSTYILVGDWEISAQSYSATEDKICFWATVPNAKMENNLDNNLACLTMIATNSNEVLTAQTHRIFPNPTDGFINIEFENLTKIETIKVINQIGQIVDNQIINKEISNYKMDISHLPKGIYFMEIWTENGRQIGKVIRN